MSPPTVIQVMPTSTFLPLPNSSQPNADEISEPKDATNIQPILEITADELLNVDASQERTNEENLDFSPKGDQITNSDIVETTELSSITFSQDSCNSKVVEHLEKLKVLFSHNFEIIYSDVALYNELLQVVKDLQDFKMYLNGVNLGIFTAVQIIVNSLPIDIPFITNNLSSYAQTQQEHDTIFQMLRSLIDEKKAAEKRCEELLKDRQDFDIKIDHLEKELQLAKEGREKTMTDFKEIINLRDKAWSKFFDECPKGTEIRTKLKSHEENYRIAVEKKSSLTESWTTIQSLFHPKPM
jgi:hypothetical protein